MAAVEPDTFRNPTLREDAKCHSFTLLEVGCNGTAALGTPPFLYKSTMLRAR
jgi:hypothetical protein